MVNFDLIEQNALGRQAIVLLIESGVLLEMKQELLVGLASGDSAEPEEAMLKRIREYRNDLTIVESLIDLGERIKRKQENENEPR